MQASAIVTYKRGFCSLGLGPCNINLLRMGLMFWPSYHSQTEPKRGDQINISMLFLPTQLQLTCVCFLPPHFEHLALPVTKIIVGRYKIL